jgi:Tfp pilus assembly protein PilO
VSSSNRTIVAILVVVALAAAFWLLLLGPKRQKADDLSGQVEQLRSSLIQSESQAAEAARARRKFPADYRQLVVLGKAVPGNDDTGSLLVQLNQIAEDSHVKFQSITLQSSGGSSTTTTPANTNPSTASASALTSPTEVAASLLPLGATIGSAGLGVMPYNLTFSGSFFNIADFIQGVDSLVHTGHSSVRATGRLVTLDGFALTAAAEGGFPKLDANFTVTTYLVPPSQGVTAGATPTAPAPATTSTTPTTDASAK